MFMILLSMALWPMTTDSLTIDFGAEQDGSNWRTVNDGVMGGRSQGRATLTAESISFIGVVSLENNGGFASLRSPYGQFDLSAYDTVELRVRGTGCAFGLTFSLSRRWFDPNYKHMFTPTEEWQVLRLPLADFDVYQIGRKGNTKLTRERQSQIIRLGLITDKDPGPFELEVDYVRFE